MKRPRIFAQATSSFLILAGAGAGAQVILPPVSNFTGPRNAQETGIERPENAGAARDRYDEVFGSPGGAIPAMWTGTEGRFGHAISVKGNRMIVTSLAKSAAYLYVKDGSGNWVIERFIYRGSAGNPATAVAMSDDSVLLGDPRNLVFSDGLGFREHGGAFILPFATADNVIRKFSQSSEGGVFEYSVGHPGLNYVSGGAGWLLGDTAQTTITGGSLFGQSVAWDGLTAVAGAPDFKTGGVRTGGVWKWTEALTQTPFQTVSSATALVPLTALDANADFGASVALEGGLVAIGAPGQGTRGTVFLHTRAGFEQIAGLFTLPENARYGSQVALSGNTLAVSAPGPLEDGGSLQTGRVFIYDTTNITTPVAVDPPETAFRFGASLALEGDRLLVGSWGGSSGSTGASYLYQRDSLGTWHYKAKLAVPGIPNVARFGRAVALAGDDAYVTALTDSSDGPAAGRVYEFDISEIITEVELSVVFPDPAPFDGQIRPAQVTISPNTLPFTVTYNGSIVPPSNAGSYDVVVTFDEPGYAPITRTGTIEITKAEEFILFPAIPVLEAQDASRTLVFQTASGRVPTVVSSAPALLSVSTNPTRINPLAIGSVTLTATLPDSANSGPATATKTVLIDDFRAVGRPPLVTPLLPAGTAQANDQLGVQVAIGDLYAAASRKKIPAEPRPVSLFRRLRSGDWVSFAELPLPPSPNDQYGTRLAVSGSIIAVGDASWSNSVHIYEVIDGNVTGPFTLGGGSQVSEMGWRPIALSSDGKFLFASVARGTNDPPGVRVYRRDGLSQWALHQTLVHLEGGNPAGAYFGWRIATSGSDLAISSPSVNSGQGVVFTYRLDPGTNLWQPAFTIPGTTPATFGFGTRLDLKDGRLLISNPSFSGYGDGREGQIYVYDLAGDELPAPGVIDSPPGQMSFGMEAVLFGGRVAVKSLDTGTNGQALSYFRNVGGAWETLAAPALGDLTSFVNETTLASSEAGTLMVGLPREENPDEPENSGRVVFLNSDNEAIVTQGITPSFAGGSGITSVATFGSTIACGIDFHTEPSRFNQGKILIFNATSGIDQPVQDLTANEPRPSAFFGRAIALGGTHLVATHSGLSVGGGQFPIELEVFRRDVNGLFAHTQTLTLSDTTPSGGSVYRLSLNDSPGSRALAIGLPAVGAVHLFSFNETTGLWQFAQRIADTSAGKYGEAVAIHGDRMVIGAPGTSTSSNGRIDIYRRNSTSGFWDFLQSPALVNPPGTPTRQFGLSAAIGGDWIAAGGAIGTSTLNSRLHFFSYGADTATTHVSSISGTYEFGRTLATAGPYLAVGEALANDGLTGRMYLYLRDLTGWREVGRIDGTDGQTAFLGRTLSVGSNFAVAGHRMLPGTRDILFRFLPLSNPSFTQWTLDFELEGAEVDPLADPTGEGLPNFMRYALGIPGNAPISPEDREKLPRVIRSETGEPVLTFRIGENAPDEVKLEIEASDDLGASWHTLGTRENGVWSFDSEVDATTSEQAGEGTTVELTPSISNDPKKFFRLKAE